MILIGPETLKAEVKNANQREQEIEVMDAIRCAMSAGLCGYQTRLMPEVVKGLIAVGYKVTEIKNGYEISW